MFRCVLVAEEDFGGVFEFSTKAELMAFCKGVNKGSGMYGAGSCAAYELEDLDDLKCDEDPSEHTIAAIAAIKEHLATEKEQSK